MSDPSPKLAERDGQIPELDGVRGLAIAMVIGFHLIQGVPCIRCEVPELIRKTSSLGQTGVDLFFVLSGFLITGILLKHREHSRALLNFWGRRFLRIFPLYYFVLTLVVFIPVVRTLPASESAADWWMWSYLANMPPTLWGQDVSLPHFWSLAVEEQFYLFWPLLVLWLNPKSVGWLCVVLFLLSPLARAGCLALGWSAFYALPCRMDALAAGGWLAAMVHLNRFHLDQLRRLRLAIPGVLIASGIWFAWMTGKGSDVVQIAKHSLCSVIFLWLIAEGVVGSSTGRLNQVMRWSWLRGLGKYSYGLYVLHPLLMALVNSQVTVASRGPLVAAVATVAIVAGSFLLALTTWNLLESPCLKLKRYFQYDRQPQLLATSAEVT